MSTSYGLMILKNGTSGMVHLLKPVCFKGGLTHYSIQWETSGKRETLTSDDVSKFTYCSK